MRQAQANVAATDPNSYLVVTDTFGLHGDALHFNTAGQIAMGEAFADAYIASVPEPATLPLLLLAACLTRRRR